MRIGLISGEFPPMPGGVGDFTRILGERLVDLGDDVYVLSRAGPKSGGLELSVISSWGPACIPAIRAWVRRCGITIVNLQFQTAAYDMSPFVHFLPAFLQAPVVTTFHDLRHPYLFPKAGPLRDWIVMRLARSSAGVIVTNQEDNLRLQALPRRRLIPLGSSVPSAPGQEREAAAWRQRAGAEADTFVLGYFGFIKAVKGLDYLIKALARLRARGCDWRLILFGGGKNTVDNDEDAAYLQRLKQRIRQQGLTDLVTWTGYLTEQEAAACFQAVDLMALPFTDGASFRRSSLIAAIHNGCAILTTEPAVKVEVFQHASNLWLVPANSPEAIENAIARLMRESDQLKRLRQGAAQLSAHFDWDAIAHETVDFFQSFN
ncbi:MAG: glycosyltransferase family 4 protein [Chloroflexi bacterium]|nr:glycosyltransferase family 4 protein [Chloroflexota bacterium]